MTLVAANNISFNFYVVFDLEVHLLRLRINFFAFLVLYGSTAELLQQKWNMKTYKSTDDKIN